MEFFTRIIISIISAIIGYLIPKIIAYIGYRKRSRKNLSGEKFSWWTTKASHPYPSEITERIKISFNFFTSELLIINIEEPNTSSKYKGYGKIIDKQIIGTYESQEGADGTFMLTIAPDCSYMYGYWCGQSFNEAEALGELVIAKDKISLDLGKSKLASTRV